MDIKRKIKEVFFDNPEPSLQEAGIPFEHIELADQREIAVQMFMTGIAFPSQFFIKRDTRLFLLGAGIFSHLIDDLVDYPGNIRIHFNELLEKTDAAFTTNHVDETYLLHSFLHTLKPTFDANYPQEKGFADLYLQYSKYSGILENSPQRIKAFDSAVLRLLLAGLIQTSPVIRTTDADAVQARLCRYYIRLLSEQTGIRKEKLRNLSLEALISSASSVQSMFATIVLRDQYTPNMEKITANCDFALGALVFFLDNKKERTQGITFLDNRRKDPKFVIEGFKKVLQLAGARLAILRSDSELSSEDLRYLKAKKFQLYCGILYVNELVKKDPDIDKDQTNRVLPLLEDFLRYL